MKGSDIHSQNAETALRDTTGTDARSSRRASPQARRHMQMRREARSAHPELRELSGPDWRTVLALPVILAIHWSIAWLVSDTSIWIVFLVSFFIGQVVIHSAGALVHETAHRLIFQKDTPKLMFDIGLEVILASFAKQLTYQHEHISSHHPYIGDYENDYEHEDICAFQARHHLSATHPVAQRFLTFATLAVHLLPLGFLIGDLIFPRIYRALSGRSVNDRARHIPSTKAPKWQQNLFIAISLVVNVALFAMFGFLGWLYHIWSLSLFLGKCGISNLGQSLSEHHGTDEHNPTRSTYGWINLILFNTGYHNEHHTFPTVPWSRLPQLHKAAPELFSNRAEKSYLGYWIDHVRGNFTASRQNKLQGEDQASRCPAIRS